LHAHVQHLRGIRVQRGAGRAEQALNGAGETGGDLDRAALGEAFEGRIPARGQLAEVGHRLEGNTGLA
jgi:hypothetical protein